MTVFLTLLVRDEEDVIAANLEFHRSRGVEHAIVTDNDSRDSTREIVREYEREGFVTVIEEPADDYRQQRWVNRMARLADERGADWVINSDADEFWWPREGDLRTTLASVPPEAGVILAHRHDFAPRPEDGRPFWARMTLRYVESVTSLGQPLRPKVAHRAHPVVQMRMGNHDVLEPDLGERLDDGRIEIFHLPLRTYEQFENKIVRGAPALMRNPDLLSTSGRPWRRLYKRWEQGKLPQHYAKRVLAEPADGFVEDTRLRDAIAELELSRRPLAAPAQSSG